MQVLKLNGTHKLQVYTGNVNLYGTNMNTMKENHTISQQKSLDFVTGITINLNLIMAILCGCWRFLLWVISKHMLNKTSDLLNLPSYYALIIGSAWVTLQKYLPPKCEIYMEIICTLSLITVNKIQVLVLPIFLYFYPGSWLLAVVSESIQDQQKHGELFILRKQLYLLRKEPNSCTGSWKLWTVHTVPKSRILIFFYQSCISSHIFWKRRNCYPLLGIFL